MRLVVIATGLSLMFWVLEAALHVLVFEDSTLVEQTFNPAAHEVWMRLTVMSMFVVFGVYAHRSMEALRRTEDAVKLANLELTQIFETAADGMRIVDREFTVRRANDTFASLAGMDKRAIIGKKCYEVFRGHLCDTPGCPLTRVLNDEEMITYDSDKQRADGTMVPCIVTATPFRGPNGELIGIVEDFKDISDRRRTERDLMNSQHRLRELTCHLQMAREDERSRIAREIHDELGQALTALKMDLHWIGMRLPATEQELREKTETMTKLIGDTIKSVRRICSELRPTILDDFGLSAAIEWQAEEFSKRSGISYRIDSRPEEIVLDQKRSIAIFRLFQETLTNIARHADATSIEIELSEQNGIFRMLVHDNGKGIDLSQERKSDSFGLIGMQERIRELAGEFNILPGSAGGTTVSATIPANETED